MPNFSIRFFHQIVFLLTILVIYVRISNMQRINIYTLLPSKSKVVLTFKKNLDQSKVHGHDNISIHILKIFSETV